MDDFVDILTGAIIGLCVAALIGIALFQLSLTI